MISLTVYATCSLCSARTERVTGDDAAKQDAEVDRLAAELGFVAIPAASERRRSAGYLCRDCARDVVVAALDLGGFELPEIRELGEHIERMRAALGGRS